jgi:release factor glutamine methyltransferase
MPLPTKKSFFGDYVFVICENVYDPAEDSFLFAENLNINKDDYVLDMGTGSGILGIIAAEQACKVVAIDLNPHAIRCANQNAKLNSVNGKMHFIRGDLFAPLNKGAYFDTVLFNAPYVPSEENELDFWLGRSWAGGITGRQVMDKFILQAPKYLQKTGKIMFMQSTLTSVADTVNKFAVNGLKAVVVASHPLPFFEKLVLLEAQYQ